MNKPLTPLADALTDCLNLLHGYTEPHTPMAALPQGEIAEFNGLRDAQQGNVCMEGQSTEYYQGFSAGYAEGKR